MGINRIRTATGRIIGPTGWEYIGRLEKKTRKKLKPCKRCGQTVEAWWEFREGSQRVGSVCLDCWCAKRK